MIEQYDHFSHYVFWNVLNLNFFVQVAAQKTGFV